MARRFVPSAVVFVVASVAALASFAEPPPVPAPPPNPPAPSAAPVGPSPHIKFDVVTLNLGDVVRGEDAVATFTYHNTGDLPLHILSAKPG